MTFSVCPGKFGYSCTRAAGHDGPCAVPDARPADVRAMGDDPDEVRFGAIEYVRASPWYRALELPEAHLRRATPASDAPDRADGP